MSNDSKKTLGEIILNDIKDRGLNQSKIAEKLHVSRQTINSLDKRKTFTIEFLNDLKRATGLDYTKYAATSIDAYDLVDNYNIKTIVEESPQEYKVSDFIGKYQLTFGITNVALENFKAFNEEIKAISEKYGMKIL